MKHKNIIKATLLLLSSLSTMCTGVVSPALPIIQRALEAEGATDIGLIVKMMVVVPNVFIAIFAPIFGYVVPKIGKLMDIILTKEGSKYLSNFLFWLYNYEIWFSIKNFFAFWQVVHLG